MPPLEFSRQLLNTLTRHTRLERWPLRQAEAALRRAGWQILTRRPGQVTLIHPTAFAKRMAFFWPSGASEFERAGRRMETSGVLFHRGRNSENCSNAPVSVTLCDQSVSPDLPAHAWQRAWMFEGSPIIPPLLRSRGGRIFTQPAPDQTAQAVPDEVRRSLLAHYPRTTPGQVVSYQRRPRLAGLP